MLRAGFIAACAIAFAAGVGLTIHFCRSMGGGMDMPGGWTMSMMWMPMPGCGWGASAMMFLFMWLAMMVAMMMPSALPMFLRTKHSWASLGGMASGYFIVWLAAGVVLYPLGIELAMAAMRSEWFSRAVPWLLGATLIAAGMIQFTRWKLTHLLRCRSSLGCASPCPQSEMGFRLGCRQGLACCLCCAAPMTVQLALGIMNPLVMIAGALVIAAEKLLPWPATVARLVGLSAIIAGLASICVIFLRSG